MKATIDYISAIWTFLTYAANAVIMTMKVTYHSLVACFQVLDAGLDVVEMLSEFITSENITRTALFAALVVVIWPAIRPYLEYHVKEHEGTFVYIRSIVNAATSPRMILIDVLIQACLSDLADPLLYVRILFTCSLYFVHKATAFTIKQDTVVLGGVVQVIRTVTPVGEDAFHVVVPAAETSVKYHLDFSAAGVQNKKEEKMTSAPILPSKKEKLTFAVLSKDADGAFTFVGNGFIMRDKKIGHERVITATHNYTEEQLYATVGTTMVPLPRRSEWVEDGDKFSCLVPKNLASQLGVRVNEAKRVNFRKPVTLISIDANMKTFTSSGSIVKIKDKDYDKYEYGHTASTTEGWSGCPAFQDGFVVGLHSGATAEKDLNFFTSLSYLVAPVLKNNRISTEDEIPSVARMSVVTSTGIKLESSVGSGDDYEVQDMEELFRSRFTRSVYDKLSESEKEAVEDAQSLYDKDRNRFKDYLNEMNEVFEQGYTANSDAARKVRAKYRRNEESMPALVRPKAQAGTGRDTKATKVWQSSSKKPRVETTQPVIDLTQDEARPNPGFRMITQAESDRLLHEALNNAQRREARRKRIMEIVNPVRRQEPVLNPVPPEGIAEMPIPNKRAEIVRSIGLSQEQESAVMEKVLSQPQAPGLMRRGRLLIPQRSQDVSHLYNHLEVVNTMDSLNPADLAVATKVSFQRLSASTHATLMSQNVLTEEMLSAISEDRLKSTLNVISTRRFLQDHRRRIGNLERENSELRSRLDCLERFLLSESQRQDMNAAAALNQLSSRTAQPQASTGPLTTQEVTEIASHINKTESWRISKASLIPQIPIIADSCVVQLTNTIRKSMQPTTQSTSTQTQGGSSLPHLSPSTQ